MADNVPLNAGSGGATVATDDIGGIQYQRVKATFGADGVATDVSAANPFPVSGLAPLTGSASLTAAAQALTMALGGRYANTVFQVTGTWVGTLVFEASNDGFTNTTTINALRAGDATISQTITDAAMNDIYRATTAGFNAVRLRMSAFTSGTAVITAIATEQASGVFLNFPLPAGSNAIGSVSVSNFPANQAVTVSAALPAGANLIGKTGIDQTTPGTTNNVSIAELRATTLWVTATAATGAVATASLPGAGAGLFHYITAIDIQLYATAARTGAAAPVIVTTTNLPGSPAWNFPTAQAIGTIDRYDVPLLTPLKSSAANTISTIAAPIATTGLWRINVGYYVGP
jgi:hypothetical protein